jgi:hypothetical protein
MQTKQYNLYELHELSDKAKEKARDWYKLYDEYIFLSEDMAEYLPELLEKNNLKCDDAKIWYSLSYCQGDGAMFEGTVNYKSYYATIMQSGHYNHYNSKTIELRSMKTDIEASDKVYQEFDDIYVDICRALEKYGYEHIESQRSDEVVDENIAANEYTFLEDGTRAN